MTPAEPRFQKIGASAMLHGRNYEARKVVATDLPPDARRRAWALVAADLLDALLLEQSAPDASTFSLPRIELRTEPHPWPQRAESEERNTDDA